MIGILLNFLHIFALILLVRICLPTQAAFLNPYTIALDVKIKRLAMFFRAGIPLSLRGICLFLLGVTLLGRAAILATLEANQMFVAGPFVLITFNAQNFIDWFLVECIDFAFFYLSILTATTFFRLWHLLKPITGFVADTFFLAGYPFIRLRLSVQCAVLVISGMLLFAGIQALGPQIEYPFQMMMLPNELPPEQFQAIRNAFDFKSLPVGVWHFTLSLLTVLTVFLKVADTILMVGFLFFFAILMRSRYIHLLVHELLQLLCGRIPMFRIASINLTPILLFLFLPFVYTFITILIILLIRVFLNVV